MDNLALISDIDNYDEELDADVCTLNLDMDEMVNFMTGQTRDCPYFKFYDEYKSVQKQI